MSEKITAKVELANRSADLETINADLAKIGSTSGKIRYLHSQGWSRGAIALHLNKRYQHVRNVLITPIKE